MLRNVVFLRGVEIGVTGAVASCCVLLAPYCLATGYVLTVACRVAGQRLNLSLPTDSAGGEGIGRVYLLDNLGNVLGGLAFVLVLVQFFDHFVILYFAAVANLLLAALLAAETGRRRLAAAVGNLAGRLLAVIAFGNLDDLSRRLEYAGQHVLFHGASPYGSLVVTRVGRTTELHRERRAAVLHRQRRRHRRDGPLRHGPAPARPPRAADLRRRARARPARCSNIPVEAVDYVELDPLILEVARRYVPESLADPRIHVINTDGRRFVRQAEQECLPH